MNGITHKQAMKWIDRRQDGLLKVNQQSLLDEHLHSCDSCRSYSETIEQLASRLTNEFETRWQDDPGPSRAVVENVTAKAKEIPAVKRFSYGLSLAGGLAVLVILGIVINFFVSQLKQISPVANGTQSVSNFPQAEDRLLAFSSAQGGDFDIYTMHADGSGLTNITNQPGFDGFPHWSPDGKQIAFESDRDGSNQLYLMNGDGSNVVRLTKGDSDYGLDSNGYTPWSPNGQKIIVLHKSAGDGYKLNSIDLLDGSTTLLTKDPGQYLLPSWSPDGSHVAFLSFDESRSRQDLFVVESDGSHLTNLTENLQGITDYEWSADGASLLFGASKKLYSSTLDGALTIIAESSDIHHLDWWVGGVVPLEFGDKQLSWGQPGGSKSSLELCQDNGEMRDIAHKRSNRGNWMINTNCSASGWMLYWANPDGTAIHPLSISPIPDKGDTIFNMTWSPDDQYLAFVGSNVNSPNVANTLYVLDVAKALVDPSIKPVKLSNSVGPSWQPVIQNRVVEEKPTPRPSSTSEMVTFSSAQGGDFDIYTMHADGSQLTNITNQPGYDGFPHWSPDGKQIAFESDRDGSKQIYLMDADGSNVIQLTHGENSNGILDGTIGNGFLGGTIRNPWSPDGRQLIFSQSIIGDLNHQFYVMDVATKKIIPLTKDAGAFYSPVWSPDGKHVAFISDETQGNNPILRRLYIADSQGTQLTNLTEGLPEGESVSLADYYWSSDGTSLTFVTDSQRETYKSTVYRASMDGSRIQVTQTSQKILDWWNDITLQTDLPQKVNEITWLIVRPDGSRSSLGTCQSSDQPVAYDVERSSDGALVFGSHCLPAGWMFYGTNPDGTAIHELLTPPLDQKYDSIFDMSWSPDDHFLAFMAVDEENVETPDLYILNANDPSTQPLKMENSSSPSWQPTANENFVKEKSSAKLVIDPQSCKPAEGESVPAELDGYDVIQNASLTEGDFTYDFWLYCDPALKPDDPEHYSGIAGLGIYSSWRYTGPQVDGGYQFHYAFDPGEPFGETGADGPLYKASAKEKDGIYLSESRIREIIQQGLPLQFSIVVDSSLGQDGAVLSFAFEPTQDGLRIVDAHAGQLNMENSVKEEPTPRPAETVSSSRLIAFTAIGRNGNTDIFTVHPDGSWLMNLTNNAAKESYLAWAPDGKRLVFSSGQEGNRDLFSMNADGSDLTHLTNDPGDEAFSLWSPDGKKIAYSLYEPDQKTANLYVMDANGENKHRLTDRHPDPDAYGVWAEVWSLDNQFIFYSEQDQINKVNVESGEITSLPVRMSSFLTQRNDSKLLYFSSCEGSAGVFCFTPQTIAEDGTGKETYQTIALQEVCTAKSSPQARNIDYYYLTKWSPDRTKIVFQFNCSDLGQLFYIANADGSGFRPLLSDFLPTGIGPNYDIDLDWSPDSRSIIFPSSPDDPNSQDLYILNIEDALQNPESKSSRLNLSIAQAGSLAWQPFSNNVTVKETPTPEPAQTTSHDGLVAFTSAMQDGNLDIYTMRPDGSELVNLTNHPAHDINPVWSPDGKRIAFESDRDGNLHIYLMNADGSGLTQLTRSDGADRLGREISSVWSPDGSKLIFMGFNDQWDTYMVNADGSGLTRLPEVGQSAGMDIQARWSPDGRHVGFISSNTEAMRIHVVDAESKSLETITDLLPEDEVLANSSYHWSPDGKSLYFTAYRQVEEGQFRWTAYEADLAAHRLIEKGTSSTPMEDWWDGTAFITGYGNGTTMTWLPSDGTYTTLNFLENCEIPDWRNLAYGLFPKRSSRGNLLIAVTCPNKDVWFFWANPGGTVTKQLLTSPINISPNNSLNGIAWSTDDGYAAFLMRVNGITYMYILDIREALQSPVSLSEPVAIGGGDLYFNISWQPVP